ncbi:MAG: hypothetical protein CSA18_01035 [Deltaproteobacteria bacterium]|nr:MAG: hypothetical protein CSA18_01035 [Deltaproteobacteria bacterium]
MKSIYIALILFIISFAAGFFAAPDKIKKAIPREIKDLGIIIGEDSSDKCLPDDFIISKIKKIKKNRGKTDTDPWEILMDEIKIGGIREIEKETEAFTIHALCKAGDTNALKTYLKSGISNYNINARDKNGMTPLAIASVNMDFASMKVLIDYGASPYETSIIDDKEKDFIQIAIDLKYYLFKDYIDKILAMGINFEQGEKYLTQALLSKRLYLADSLLSITDVNAITESGNHIFTEVLENSNYRKAIDYFLNNENLTFNNVSSEHLPLIAAVENKKITAKDISKMIEKGADINLARFSDNSTALIACVKAGRADLAEVLIKNGADLDIKDINGKTARDHIKKKNSELKKLFHKR